MMLHEAAPGWAPRELTTSAAGDGLRGRGTL
jgi:hypothetical protein